MRKNVYDRVKKVLIDFGLNKKKRIVRLQKKLYDLKTKTHGLLNKHVKLHVILRPA